MSKLEYLYPVNNAFRHCLDLNGHWFFAFDDNKSGSFENGVPRNVTIPVPGALQDVFITPKEQRFTGTVWYERVVNVPKTWLGEDVFLRLDGVGHRAILYINGLEAGRHEGSTAPAVINVTRQIRYGEDNRIVIKVNTEMTPYALPAGQVVALPDGRRMNATPYDYDTPLGLFGDVKLYTVPTTRLVNVFVQTVNLTSQEAIIQYVAQVQGNCLVTATLRDRDGRIIATGVGGNAKLTVANPKIWRPGEPYLYTLELEVNRLGKQHDMYNFTFGIRTVAFRSGKLYVNGEMTRLKGLAFSGSADEYTFNDIRCGRIMRQILSLGGNAIFSGGRPMPESVLRAADEYGVMVIEELPPAGLKTGDDADGFYGKTDIKSRVLEAHLHTIKQLMGRDKNHTSVVAWSVMYEPATIGKEDEAYYKALADQALQSDWEGRPVGITLTKSIDSVWTGNIVPFKFVILKNWANCSPEDIQLAEADMYRELLAWQVKYPETGIFVRLGGHRMGYERRGATTYAEQAALEATLSGLLKTSFGAPNVQGQLLGVDTLGASGAKKANWKE